MGLDPKLLPDAFRRCMPQPERKAMALPTMGEVEERQAAIAERKLHQEFENWLRIKGIPYVHSRMDRKPTIRKGWPDFSAAWHGLACYVEIKSATGELSQDQIDCIKELRDAGNPVLVSCSLDEMIRWAIGILGI